MEDRLGKPNDLHITGARAGYLTDSVQESPPSGRPDLHFGQCSCRHWHCFRWIADVYCSSADPGDSTQTSWSPIVGGSFWTVALWSPAGWSFPPRVLAACRSMTSRGKLTF